MELLVVVSIISLLMALLLPSLSKAREQARRLQCSTNLKAIATASLTYAAADSQDQCVPIHPLTGVVVGDSGAYDWGGKAGRGESTLGEDPISSIWGTQFGRGPASRPLNAILYKSAPTDYGELPGPHQSNWIADTQLEFDVFRCPSDRGYTGHHYTTWAQSRMSSYEHYGNSYAANTLGGSLGLLNEHLYISNSPFFRSTTLVPIPARTVYYLENAGRFAWHVSRGSSGDPTGCHQRDSGVFGSAQGDRHIKGWHRHPFWVQSAFVDGHAVSVEMQGFLIPPPKLSFYPNVEGNVTDKYLPTWETWRCIIVRSRDWVLDTLPAAAILTPIPIDYHTPYHAEIR